MKFDASQLARQSYVNGQQHHLVLKLLDMKTLGGETALMKAAEASELAVVLTLLRERADPWYTTGQNSGGGNRVAGSNHCP